MKITENHSSLVKLFTVSFNLPKPLTNSRIGNKIIKPKKCSIRVTNYDILGKAIVPFNPPLPRKGALNRTGYLTGASKALAAFATETSAGPNFFSTGSSVFVMVLHLGIS